MASSSIDAHRSRDRAGDRQRILEMIIRQPRTLDELAAELGVEPNRISGRLTELSKAGLIARTGQTRKTRTGAAAAVWAAADVTG
jgi:predicted ArsR family transcriptional regulator